MQTSTFLKLCSIARSTAPTGNRFGGGRVKIRLLLKQSLASGKVVDRPDALVSFEELHDIMGMHEIEEMEQRYLTREQLEAKYGRGRKASIMPDVKPVKSGAKPTKPAAKSKQTA